MKATAEDDAEAVRRYRKATAQGDSGAQFHLGAMHDNGDAVPQDFVAAHMWTNLAGASGNWR